jgi:hypothetical protein
MSHWTVLQPYNLCYFFSAVHPTYRTSLNDTFPVIGFWIPLAMKYLILAMLFHGTSHSCPTQAATAVHSAFILLSCHREYARGRCPIWYFTVSLPVNRKALLYITDSDALPNWKNLSCCGFSDWGFVVCLLSCPTERQWDHRGGRGPTFLRRRRKSIPKTRAKKQMDLRSPHDILITFCV